MGKWRQTAHSRDENRSPSKSHCAGVVHFELLPVNVTVTTDINCE